MRRGKRTRRRELCQRGWPGMGDEGRDVWVRKRSRIYTVYRNARRPAHPGAVKRGFLRIAQSRRRSQRSPNLRQCRRKAREERLLRRRARDKRNRPRQLSEGGREIHVVHQTKILWRQPDGGKPGLVPPRNLV